MSRLIAFCERYNRTRMLNLLRHCPLVTMTQEVLALEVLEEHCDDEQKRALKTIRESIHPVEINRTFRAVMTAKDDEIIAMEARVEELTNRVASMRARLHQLQIVEVPDTQMPEDDESQKTNPELADAQQNAWT
jgi:hypothetical protein